jgi:hypothetical protein
MSTSGRPCAVLFTGPRCAYRPGLRLADVRPALREDDLKAVPNRKMYQGKVMIGFWTPGTLTYSGSAAQRQEFHPTARHWRLMTAGKAVRGAAVSSRAPLRPRLYRLCALLTCLANARYCSSVGSGRERRSNCWFTGASGAQLRLPGCAIGVNELSRGDATVRHFPPAPSLPRKFRWCFRLLARDKRPQRHDQPSA